jgi:putative membrane protein
MIRLATLCGVVGLACVTGFLIYHGVGPILAALSTAGIGLVWASLFHVVPMTVNAYAWRVLFAVGPKPTLPRMVFTVWIREAVNTMLPVARVGGEAASYRVLTRMGYHAIPVVASLITDMTFSMVSQALFTIIGLVLLLMRAEDTAVIWRVVFGLLVFIPLVGGLIALQRYGIANLGAKLVARLFGTRWADYTSNADLLDRMIRLIYRRPSRILISTFGQFLGWVLGSGELWLALHYLGHPAPYTDALLLESMVQAVSATIFIVPGAIGVQEGAFVLFCTLIGLPADIGFALALARRFRDLLIYIPGLIAWQFREMKRLVFPSYGDQARDSSTSN